MPALDPSTNFYDWDDTNQVALTATVAAKFTPVKFYTIAGDSPGSVGGIFFDPVTHVTRLDGEQSHFVATGESHSDSIAKPDDGKARLSHVPCWHADPSDREADPTRRARPVSGQASPGALGKAPDGPDGYRPTGGGQRWC